MTIFKIINPISLFGLFIFKDLLSVVSFEPKTLAFSFSFLFFFPLNAVECLIAFLNLQ